MRTLTTSRSGQIRLSLLDRKRDFPARVLLQAATACRQVFDRVDIDLLRNQVNNLPLSRWLLANRENTIAFRKLVRDEGTLIDRLYLPIFELVNEWRRLNKWLNRPTAEPVPIHGYTRIEKLGALTFAPLAFLITAANAEVGTNYIGPDLQLVAAAVNLVQEKVMPSNPDNWVEGKAELKGSKAAVLGAYNYAKQAGYTFAANEAERDQMIADGTLVRLDSKYIRLNNASSPYVLPVVARFVDRLGEQYAATGCGKLVVNGGMRPFDFQGTLKNGSKKSVHPTGMATDLERIIAKNAVEKYCLNLLATTLAKVEKLKRADATEEDFDRHFHVVVVPHVYEAFLARQPKIDPEVKWLATALYFETARNESMEGYRAIGWVIRNRMRSTDYPNTIVEVVADGAAGRSAGGCQFSFMCDGKVEHIKTLCTKPDRLMKQYWLSDCDQKWEAAVEIAEQILAEPESADPTGGAILYYAASMKDSPYWTKYRVETRTKKNGSKYYVTLPNGDFKPGTIRQIGSHVFGCGIYDDACRS